MSTFNYGLMTVAGLTEFTRVSCQALYQIIYGFVTDAKATKS